jgi:FkbM family methyltransferase
MIDISKFDWGQTSEDFKRQSIKEIFEESSYEKFFEVEENDIVVDIGASVGEFTYSILKKNPKHCYVVEPLSTSFDTLKKNLEGYQVSFTNAAITSDKYCKITWDNYTEESNTLTFSDFLKNNRLFQVDFLKFDCEGGEYDIFSPENIEFLKNTPKIVCEIHLGDYFLKAKFRNFRDNILPNFKNYEVYSFDNVNIKWDLWNEHFIEHYSEVYFYFDNR